MKRMIVAVALIFSATALWRLGSLLSADAVGMAVGVLLGVLAGIPVSLLVLASSRRREERDEERWQEAQRMRAGAMPYQPPVIVLAGQQAAPPVPQIAPPSSHAAQGWPQPSTQRQFKMVGEQERWIE